MRPWADFRCWNAMSGQQQDEMTEFGHTTDDHDGPCQASAVIGISLVDDRGPGLRYYCESCALAYLREQGVVP